MVPVGFPDKSFQNFNCQFPGNQHLFFYSFFYFLFAWDNEKFVGIRCLANPDVYCFYNSIKAVIIAFVDEREISLQLLAGFEVTTLQDSD